MKYKINSDVINIRIQHKSQPSENKQRRQIKCPNKK